MLSALNWIEINCRSSTRREPTELDARGYQGVAGSSDRQLNMSFTSRKYSVWSPQVHRLVRGSF